MGNRTITLRHTKDEDGSRFLGASLSDDGVLTIEGQDLGRGVERFFGDGNVEYEWSWTLPPTSVDALRESLGGGEDILALLAARFSGDAAAQLKSHLDGIGVQYETWSRIGD